MATYQEIQGYVRQQHGFVPKTCWVAHAKELCGLSPRIAVNRKGKRMYPCPEDKLDAIKDAFLHYRMI